VSQIFGNEQGQCPGALNWTCFGILLIFWSGLKMFPFLLYIDNKICDRMTTSSSSSSNRTAAVTLQLRMLGNQSV